MKSWVKALLPERHGQLGDVAAPHSMLENRVFPPGYLSLHQILMLMIFNVEVCALYLEADPDADGHVPGLADCYASELRVADCGRRWRVEIRRTTGITRALTLSRESRETHHSVTGNRTNAAQMLSSHTAAEEQSIKQWRTLIISEQEHANSLENNKLYKTNAGRACKQSTKCHNVEGKS